MFLFSYRHLIGVVVFIHFPMIQKWYCPLYFWPVALPGAFYTNFLEPRIKHIYVFNLVRPVASYTFQLINILVFKLFHLKFCQKSFSNKSHRTKQFPVINSSEYFSWGQGQMQLGTPQNAVGDVHFCKKCTFPILPVLQISFPPLLIQVIAFAVDDNDKRHIFHI